jgi:hypothetical protein
MATHPKYENVNGIGASSVRAENPFLYIPLVFRKAVQALLFRSMSGYWRIEYVLSGGLLAYG